MPLDVRRTLAANEDLHRIWLYIQADNEKAADNLIRRLDSIFQRLRHNPELGRARPELGSGLRSFPHRRYLIVYRPDDAVLTIVRVLSAYRDLSGQDFPAD